MKKNTGKNIASPRTFMYTIHLDSISLETKSIIARRSLLVTEYQTTIPALSVKQFSIYSIVCIWDKSMYIIVCPYMLSMQF
jgi:hypothetical protein